MKGVNLVIGAVVFYIIVITIIIAFTVLWVTSAEENVYEEPRDREIPVDPVIINPSAKIEDISLPYSVNTGESAPVKVSVSSETDIYGKVSCRIRNPLQLSTDVYSDCIRLTKNKRTDLYVYVRTNVTGVWNVRSCTVHISEKSDCSDLSTHDVVEETRQFEARNPPKTKLFIKNVYAPTSAELNEGINLTLIVENIGTQTKSSAISCKTVNPLGVIDSLKSACSDISSNSMKTFRLPVDLDTSGIWKVKDCQASSGTNCNSLDVDHTSDVTLFIVVDNETGEPVDNQTNTTDPVSSFSADIKGNKICIHNTGTGNITGLDFSVDGQAKTYRGLFPLLPGQTSTYTLDDFIAEYSTNVQITANDHTVTKNTFIGYPDASLRYFADDFWVGTLVTKRFWLYENESYYQIRNSTYATQFNNLISSTMMKYLVPDSDWWFENNESKFNYKMMDTQMGNAIRDNQKLFGSSLVYKDTTTPPWLGFVDENQTKTPDCGGWNETPEKIQELDDILKELIQTTIQYGGDTYYVWQVINEPINDNGKYTPWYCWRKMLGNVSDGSGNILYPSYVEKSLRYAREVTSKKLMVNENFFSNRESINWPKAEKFFELIRNLQADSIPVDVVGIQLHLSAHLLNESFYPDLRWFFEEVESLGLEVMITEIDIYEGGEGFLSSESERFENQKQLYHDILELCLEYDHCTGLTVWDLVDSDTWLRTKTNNPYPDAHPLLFYDSYSPKPAFFGLVEAFIEAEPSACDDPCGVDKPLRYYADRLDFKVSSLRKKNYQYDNLELHNSVQSTEHNHILTGISFNIVQNTQGEFDFSRLDEGIALAQANDMTVHGFHLIWHDKSAGSWLGFYDRDTKTHLEDCGNWTVEELDQILEDHIKTVVEYGKGKVKYWNVINEPLRYRDLGELFHWQQTCWATILGNHTYMEKAFQYAREADPDAVLLINEALATSSGRIGVNSTWAYEYTQLIADLLAKGTPIDAAGVQMHLNVDELMPHYNQTLDNFHNFIEDMDALGIDVMVTEMDVFQETPDLELQAQIYQDIFDVCLSHENCIGINTWGLSDKYSWWRTWLGYPESEPLPFDENYNKKPAYFSILETLRNATCTI